MLSGEAQADIEERVNVLFAKFLARQLPAGGVRRAQVALGLAVYQDYGLPGLRYLQARARQRREEEERRELAGGAQLRPDTGDGQGHSDQDEQ